MSLLRSLFDPDGLMSGVAMVRDVPRALRLKQVDGSLFFTEKKRNEYRQRIESVTLQSARQWGAMNVDQMLHHLNLACGGSLGFYDLPDESNLATRTVGKWLLWIGCPSSAWVSAFLRASKSRMRRDLSSRTRRHNC